MSEPSQDRPFVRRYLSAAEGADEQRLQMALVEIAQQDHPRVTINTRPNDNLYSLEGRAESDLDLICDRLRDDYHIAINVGPTQAILLETIRKPAEAEGKYIRQTGGSGNYGHCKLRIEPVEPGRGYEFVNGISGGSVPGEYIRPIDEGVQAAMESGILGGFPMVDVKVTLTGGSYHEDDSNEMAFKFAASIAFKEAARKASPVILEPMMAVEINVPDHSTAITIIEREISQHRGRIDQLLRGKSSKSIRAIVPLSELLNSGLRGPYESPMTFAGYEPLRDNGISDDDRSGVTANKPRPPRPAVVPRWLNWNQKRIEARPGRITGGARLHEPKVWSAISPFGTIG